MSRSCSGSSTSRCGPTAGGSTTSTPCPAPTPARGLLAHIVLGECIWFERIAGGQKTPSTFQELEEDELLTRLENNRRDYLRLIETRLDEVVEFRRDTGVEYHATVSDALLHPSPTASITGGSSPPTTRAGRSPTPAPTHRAA